MGYSPRGMRSLVYLYLLLLFSLWTFASQAKVVNSIKSAKDLIHGPLIYVIPEGKSVIEKSFLESPQSVLVTTEAKRIPRLSTGDIVKALRERVEKGPLICEAKAAADCIEALLQYPELSANISIFLTIDGYIQGAPFAEGAPDPLELSEVSKAEKMPLMIALRFLVDWMTDFIRGFDLFRYHFRHDRRVAYLKANRSRLLQLSKQVDIICIDRSPKNYGRFPFELH